MLRLQGFNRLGSNKIANDPGASNIGAAPPFV